MSDRHNAFLDTDPDFPSQSLGWIQLSNGQQMRYDEFVAKLFKRQETTLMKLHAALGVCGEAGELADAIKKEVIYDKDMDRNNLVEELGDLRFYVQAAQNCYGITEQEVLQHNACKLMQRYEGLEYSDKAAQDRKDKSAEAVAKVWTEEFPLAPAAHIVLNDTQLRAVDDTAGLEEINHPAKKTEGDSNVQN